MTSNAVVYYGAPTSQRQTVSDEVSSRGLNLTRSTPSASRPIVTKKFVTTSYLNYVGRLGAAFKAAELNQWIKPGSKQFFYKSARTTTTPFMRTPVVVWNYDRTKTPDDLSRIRERFDAVESVSRGKPSFAAKLSPDRMKTLVQETSPNDKTPASTTTINIDAYRVYVFLHRLADLCLRVHQYPLVAWSAIGDGSLEKHYKESFQVKEEDLKKHYLKYGEGDKEHQVFGGNTLDTFRFHMNLKQPLDETVYTVSQASDLTADGIILFPFVSALAKWDAETVPRVIEQYLYTLLSNTAADALETFQWIKSGWGVLCETMWGDELSHLYSGIGLMLETGARLNAITTPNNIYQGFLLVGGGYELEQWDVTYAPVANSSFVELFDKASPHQSHFNTILDLVEFEEDIEKEAARRDINQIAKLAKLLRENGFNKRDEGKIHNAARFLCFPKDNFLPMTAFNVAKVLQAMVDNTPEEEFPMHPCAILEGDRRKRLLSAFGGSAPSFLIAGGRSVSLDGAFKYNVVIKGKKEQQNVTRMFVIAVPWKKACEDLDKVLSDHHVLTPAGTPLANRASSMSLMREYSGPGGAAVLSSLRNVCGVVLTESGTSEQARKRGRQEEDEDASKKKARFDLF